MFPCASFSAELWKTHDCRIVLFMQQEHIFANAFNCIQELGPQRLSLLQKYFGSFETAWRASQSELRAALHDIPATASIAEKRKQIYPEQEFALLQKHHVAILLQKDNLYPEPLRQIPDSPALLYIEGTLRIFDKPGLAVVGTRTPTAYGREVCRTLVPPIAAAHVPIISGLALGIDTEAHKAALDQNGYTIAILGSGLMRSALYPASNKKLADEIVSRGGALVSEYPLQCKATQWTFPLRNRIIAGLSKAVLVIEAREKSGTRITARYAVEYNRDVLTTPGSIFSTNSWTPHSLIKEGATPITSADDILEALGISQTSEKKNNGNLSEQEQALLKYLREPLSVNELARAASADISALQRTLALLEIRGAVRNMGNGIYRKL